MGQHSKKRWSFLANDGADTHFLFPFIKAVLSTSRLSEGFSSLCGSRPVRDLFIKLTICLQLIAASAGRDTYVLK